MEIVPDSYRSDIPRPPRPIGSVAFVRPSSFVMDTDGRLWLPKAVLRNLPASPDRDCVAKVTVATVDTVVVQFDINLNVVRSPIWISTIIIKLDDFMRVVEFTGL